MGYQDDSDKLTINYGTIIDYGSWGTIIKNESQNDNDKIKFGTVTTFWKYKCEPNVIILFLTPFIHGSGIKTKSFLYKRNQRTSCLT